MSIPVTYTKNRHLDYINNVYDQKNFDDWNTRFLCCLFYGKAYGVDTWGPTIDSDYGAYQSKNHEISKLNVYELSSKTWKRVAYCALAWLMTIFTCGYLYKKARDGYLKREWIPITQDNIKYLRLGDAIRKSDEKENDAKVISYLSYEAINVARYNVFTVKGKEILKKDDQYGERGYGSFEMRDLLRDGQSYLVAVYDAQKFLRRKEINTDRERRVNAQATFN